MPQTKIAYLGLLDGDRATGAPRGERHLSAVARGVVDASQGEFAVDLISCGPTPECRSLSTGVIHRVLPWAGQPRTPWDACSWELADSLSGVALVHLHDGFSRICEVGLLVAKQWSKTVCLTEFGLTGHWLSLELGLDELADVVVCHSVAVAAKLRAGLCVEVVSGRVSPHWFGVASEWPNPTPQRASGRDADTPPEVDYVALGAELSSIYRRMLAKRREAAA
jgi:hypothetical protein